jgi:hypothetical protein
MTRYQRLKVKVCPPCPWCHEEEAAHLLETLVTKCQNTWHQIPECSTLHLSIICSEQETGKQIYAWDLLVNHDVIRRIWRSGFMAQPFLTSAPVELCLLIFKNWFIKNKRSNLWDWLSGFTSSCMYFIIRYELQNVIHFKTKEVKVVPVFN